MQNAECDSTELVEVRMQNESRAASPRIHSAFCIHRSAFSSSAFTVVELFVTIAVLIIVLGVMVDLANRVRRNSADQLTRQILRQLTVQMDNYMAHNNAQLPPVTPFMARNLVTDESTLRTDARRNNADFLRYLHTQPGPSQQDDVFHGLPLSLYDQVSLRDPWGSPIVFMPRQNPLIGMAPGDRFFFFSAGPDRRFLTRDDNLYSYEEPTMEK
jgi:type II secretory pathway pseudopilin PulG